MLENTQIDLQTLLAASAARHKHLCPRQVLGVRAALLGTQALGLTVPRRDKRLLVIIETDGCFADGIEVVTGATVGHRTLRVEDYGKIAATFVDLKCQRALRISPHIDVRWRAWDHAPGEKRHYFAQLYAYQVMPEDELFKIQEVQTLKPLQAIVSRAGIRTDCEACGEEIVNERELLLDGRILCHSCAGRGYYLLIEEAVATETPSSGET